MKKILLVLVALLTVLSLTACSGGGEGEGGTADDGDKKLKVAYVSCSNRGDDAFVDMIWGALERASNEKGIDIHIIELDNDASVYESSMIDACDTEEYDLIVTGFFQMVDPAIQAAKRYPDQKILVFDTGLDFSDPDLKNCVSVETLQNEGSFLAGALAAMLTTSDLEGMNPEKVVGFIGASSGSTIDDFLTGYIDGFLYIDPEIKYVRSYSGTFNDTALTKEIALSQIEMGADVIYSVEDIAGIGVADAAYEKGIYTIDCNSDLAMSIKDNNPTAASRISTSMCKNFGTIIYDMVCQFADGTLEMGKHYRYGLKDGGVSLADNEIFRGIVTEEMIETLKDIEAKIISGEIVVSTTIGADNDTYNALVNRALLSE